MVLLLALLMAFQQSYSPAFWQKAERSIQRLPPSAFRGVPKNIRASLEKRGCTMPQPYTAKRAEPVNIVSGSFAAPGQKDWAVLCSDGKESRIVVMWGGPARCESELARLQDVGLLQEVIPGKTGYSRELFTATAKQIQASAPSHGVAPPPVDHSGIGDAFLGKAGTAHYCYRGQWLHMPLSD